MATVEETRMMDGLWMKAVREGQVEVRLKDGREAKRLRMMLYNSVRRPRVSQEVRQARSECVVQIDGECLLITKAAKNGMTEAMAVTLGVKTFEKEMEESAARVMAATQVMMPVAAPTPVVQKAAAFGARTAVEQVQSAENFSAMLQNLEKDHGND